MTITPTEFFEWACERGLQDAPISLVIDTDYGAAVTSDVSPVDYQDGEITLESIGFTKL